MLNPSLQTNTRRAVIIVNSWADARTAPRTLTIQLTEAGKRFGPKIFFENLNWLITPKDRIGIVGGNGSGKSTLLKVLAGFEGLEYGTVTSAKGIWAGYLPQDVPVLC